MTNARNFATLASGDWDALQAAVERFEAAWDAGPPPKIAEFLPTELARRRELLVELIHVDLERRLKRGETARVEAYLEPFPELAQRRDEVVKLIVAEFEQRRRREPGLAATDYLRRFPHFQAELARALPAGNVPPAAPGAGARIVFSCPKCGRQFNVLPEFAGRKTTCPSCQDALVVPAPDLTVAYAPPVGKIDGPTSSLVRAQVASEVTLVGGAGSAPLQRLLDDQAGPGARYVIEKELARGGMGAILSAIDCDIRREVAVKYLLDQSDERNKLRFVEEAQITGQLEHPNIVPIHELGIDAQQRIFFTMKMVKGHSLAQILKALRTEPAEAGKEYGLSRLLSILVNVCNALAYAHSRRVVHRDLKPANIMVGDFGEVYVMDWGLAKVLDRSASPETGPPLGPPVAHLAVPVGDDWVPLARPATPDETPASSATGGVSFSSGSGKVVTIRESDADLTQAGDVLGTPVYMPPEQATGQIDRIDERSDVYSMGAILYEMLTLAPPIDRTGGFRQIVLRVCEGQIDTPATKAPELARAGRIPAELAAIAMKALARNKPDRYQTIESMRQDIDRFLDGRSVSAKDDTLREAIVKFVKRNKPASITSAVAALALAVVGLWSLIAILNANARTRTEQAEKLALAKRSVPTLVQAARMSINDNHLDDAFAHVNMAVVFDEDAVEPRFLRAQLLCGRAEYAAARADLEACLRLMPERAEGVSLLEAVTKTRAENADTVLALAAELSRQRAFAVSSQVAQNAAKLIASRKELEAHYRARIDAAWPGLGQSLTCDMKTGECVFMAMGANAGLRDLSPLRGMPLKRLYIDNGGVDDLSPLRGMPLKSLSLQACVNVHDLAPLEGLPLTELNLNGCTKITDLTPLKGMPLTRLNLNGALKLTNLRPLELLPLTNLDLGDCGEVTDLSPLKGMPLTYLSLHNCPKLTDLSPLEHLPLTKLDLSWSPQLADLTAIKNTPLESLNLEKCPKINDLTPLRNMRLNELNIEHCAKVSDLAPLKGMPLTRLDTLGMTIKDLAPLKDMQLTHLRFAGQHVTDLGPLDKMPLKLLIILDSTEISDLAPLKNTKLEKLEIELGKKIANLGPLAGLPLGELQIEGALVADLTPLKGMPLTVLSLYQCENVHDLTPLSDLPLRVLNLHGCENVHDLTPLSGAQLFHVQLPPQVTKGMNVLRDMKTVISINSQPAAEFWKKWDETKAK